MFQSQRTLIDGSRLMVESLARAGVEVFAGYPITPANLLYSYSCRRVPVALSAPDEITALQWIAGYAAAGRLCATATSFPGFALMLESVNMAYMMELPLVVVLAQRLGPATGSATCGAQGDLALLAGTISGGHPLPTLCASSLLDCWNLAAEALRTAVRLRAPVVLLTSKEIAMTVASMDLSALPRIEPVQRAKYAGAAPYRPYAPDDSLVPAFLEVGNPAHQVRFTASTHDQDATLQHNAPAALANTARLQEKLARNLDSFTFYELDEEPGAESLVVSWDVTALACRQAVIDLRARGRKVSLLVAKTLLPVPPAYLEILSRYSKVVVAEENLSGQFRQLLFGTAGRASVSGVNAIGRMLTPGEVAQAVTSG